MAGGSARRWGARACAIGAVACIVLLIVGPVGAQEEIDRPEVWRSSATAVGASVMADREALLPIPETFRFIALDGDATYETSNQAARSSLFFPGNGVTRGPNLLCGTFGDRFPPPFKPIMDLCLQYKYPLTVNADSLNPDGTTSGSLALGGPNDPVSANAVRATAHADIDAATTDAAMTDLRVLGLPALGPVAVPSPIPGMPQPDTSILTVDSATGRTDQRIDEAGTLVAQATSTLEGVRAVGGLLEIGSIRSRSVVTDDGKGGKTHDASLELSGVTVGGVPAQITDQGLVIGSPGGSGPLGDQLGAAVNELVRDLGMHVTLLDVEEGVDESGVATARAGGVLVEFGVDAQGLPILPGPMGDVDPNGTYVGSMVLGATGTRGIATVVEIPPFEPGDIAGVGGFVGGPADFDPGVPLSDGAALDDGGTESSGGSSPVAGAPPPADDGAQQRFVRAFDELFADRLRLLYLAFTLSALALCISPRLTLPARLPRNVP